MDQPLVVINVKEWRGRVSNVSPHKLPPGAGQIHENLRCQVPGQMDVRPGMRSANAAGSGDVLALINYPHPPGSSDRLIVHDSGGAVNAVIPS